MNDQNPEQEAVSTQPTVATVDPRRRLRELLSVPERDRSDEQWDEIIELEIQLAPGNRISAAEQGGGGGGAPGKSSGQQPKKHRPRGNNNRRPRSAKPGGGNPA